MPTGPYVQDILTRIINVHWTGGGIFIAGDRDTNIFYLQLGQDESGKPPAWKALGTLDFNKNEGAFYTGSVRGSSFAEIKTTVGAEVKNNPVFLLVGGGGATNAIGIIMASRNGREWSRVFSFGAASESYIGAVIFGVVWDESKKRFYAGGHQSDSFADPVAEEHWQAETDILFESADGLRWTEVGRTETRIEWHGDEMIPDWPEYKTGLLVEHCRNLVKDLNDNNVPDGVYGYDKNAELLIAPDKVPTIDYLTATISNYDYAGVKITALGSGSPDPADYPTNAGFPTTCVAFGGTKWAAAGGTLPSYPDDGKSQAAYLTSSTDGNQWTRLNPPGTNIIVTMAGGQISKSDAGL